MTAVTTGRSTLERVESDGGVETSTVAAQPDPAGVRIESVTKVFDAGHRAVTALDEVSLEVAPGEVFGILGRSGAGKSTLLRCINGLERPTSGRVQVGEVEVTSVDERGMRALRRQVGMVFQQFNLLDARDVRGNIALPMEIAGVPAPQRRARVEELIGLVGLQGREHAHPSRLSGGQRQRVGIARALALHPRLLLCDEATSALDSETTRSILDLLREVNEATGVTVVLITHELEVIRRICDGAALIEDGRVVESGPLTSLVGEHRSRIGEALLPLHDTGAAGRGEPHGDQVDVTLDADHAQLPFLSWLSRDLDLDVVVLAGGVERVGGREVARLRLGWQPRAALGHERGELGPEVSAAQVAARLQSYGASVVIR